MIETQTEIKQNKLNDLESLLLGELITRESDEFDSERQVYNGMIDKHPLFIIKCSDVADVQHAVNFGRENDLLIAVRGGGHNGAGLGICDEGMVIDLSGIKFVQVDPEENTVRVGGGNIWREVDHATHPFGLAIPAGIISTTGVGGLTLGGGLGYLSRKCGLTIDNLLEAEMVLADGSIVTASENSNPDLFWAIRGGGGNFGIVTSFKFQAHPIKHVYGGPVFWSIERTGEIMEWFHDLIHDAPEDLNGFIATMVVPGPPFPEALHGKKVCGIVWCCTGDDGLRSRLDEYITSKDPLFEHVGEMPYPDMQSLLDGFMPPGLQWYWKADFFKELGPEVRDIHRQFGAETPTTLSQMHLYPLSGAASKPDNDETAWANRNAKYAGVIVGVDPDPANAALITDWCKDYWKALHPYSTGSAYSNFMMEEGEERIKATFGENYKKLSRIKAKYDPENLFRVNQNIKPSSK